MEKEENEVKIPTKEEVIGWVKKDLHSAHYLLGVILYRHPEIVEELSNEIYESVMTKENGAAINHVKQTEHAD